MTCATMYYTVYVRSYPRKAVEAMYILLLYHHHELATAVAVLLSHGALP